MRRLLIFNRSGENEEDYQRVKNYTWHYSNKAILMRRKVNDKIKTIYLARFILNCYNI